MGFGGLPVVVDEVGEEEGGGEAESHGAEFDFGEGGGVVVGGLKGKDGEEAEAEEEGIGEAVEVGGGDLLEFGEFVGWEVGEAGLLAAVDEFVAKAGEGAEDGEPGDAVEGAEFGAAGEDDKKGDGGKAEGVEEGFDDAGSAAVRCGVVLLDVGVEEGEEGPACELAREGGGGKGGEAAAYGVVDEEAGGGEGGDGEGFEGDGGDGAEFGGGCEKGGRRGGVGAAFYA